MKQALVDKYAGNAALSILSLQCTCDTQLRRGHLKLSVPGTPPAISVMLRNMTSRPEANDAPLPPQRP